MEAIQIYVVKNRIHFVCVRKIIFLYSFRRNQVYLLKYSNLSTYMHLDLFRNFLKHENNIMETCFKKKYFLINKLE